MRSNITLSNCLYVRKLSKRHSLFELLQEADRFILDNFEEIIERDSFYGLDKADLELFLQSDDLDVSFISVIFAK